MKRLSFLILSCLCIGFSGCGKDNKSDVTTVVTKEPVYPDTPISSIMIVGNSIVYHGAKADIGWDGNWGMAASCADSDFVHVIQREVGKVASKTKVEWSNLGGSFEASWKTYDLTKLSSISGRDLLIVKIEENVVPADGTTFTQTELDSFIKRYDAFLKALSGTDTQVIVCGGFWPNFGNAINLSLKKFAQKNGYPYVEISDMFSNADYRAIKFSNQGVANHPSDKGMRVIAQRLLTVIKKYNLQ